jgi:hypothetical protein
MRNLSAELLAAQSSSIRLPAVSLQVNNRPGGVVSLLWERLYTGSEPAGAHSLTITGSGAMIRFRCGPVEDSRKLYRQRVPVPAPGADFSSWTFFSQYNVTAVAACSLNTAVAAFWAKTSGDICCMQSADNGASWGATEYPGTSPTGAVSQMAAAYKANGDLAVFFADSTTLYVIRRVGGVWQARAAWSHATGMLSGVAVVYDGDWKLLVAGRDTGGNYCVWSLVYGDGGELPAGSWSNLRVLAQAPADGSFSFSSVSLDKIRGDDIRCFYLENYSGSPACARPYGAYLLPAAPFSAGLWHEPAPFEIALPDCPALAHGGDYVWLATPAGVWRADCTLKSADLSPAVRALRAELREEGGKLEVELDNSSGRYSSPGTGALEILRCGSQLEFSPGYLTTAGNAYSAGLSFTLQSFELLAAPGKASLLLRGADGWTKLAEWTARYILRFTGVPVREILERVLARAGIRLVVISQSAAMTEFCPDFTVQPGDNGREVVLKLLKIVPDVLFLEGWTAYLGNPLPVDSSTFEYGTALPISEGRYGQSAPDFNHVLVEGSGVTVETFNPSDIEASSDRLLRVEDSRLITAGEALERGNAVLRKVEMAATGGLIRVPVNCGQQMYDVITITDNRAGLAGVRRRVRGILLDYLPVRGIYEQTLLLGGV